MTELIEEFRSSLILESKNDTKVDWCIMQYEKHKNNLINVLREYDCDIEGFADYMKLLVEMANVKAYPSIRKNESIALDFKKYHTIVYQIYDSHYKCSST